MSLQHWFRVGTHARCNLFRQSSKTGICEMKIWRVSSYQDPWVVLGKERFRKKKVLSWNLFFWGFISIRCWWDWLMWWLFDFIGILKYGPLRKLLGYLEKAFPSIYMPTRPQVKSFGRHKRWVGWKGCGWPFSGEVLILQFKVFLNIRWALLFSSLVPFLFSIFNIPQTHWV